MYKQAKKHFLQAVEYKNDCYRWAIVALGDWCEVGEDRGDWHDSTDLVADFDGSIARVGPSAWFWYGFYLHLLKCLSETGNETMWMKGCLCAVKNNSGCIEKPWKIQLDSLFQLVDQTTDSLHKLALSTNPQSFCLDLSILHQLCTTNTSIPYSTSIPHTNIQHNHSNKHIQNAQ